MITFIIEHLEPELYDWCLLEYRHISQIARKEYLLFTNVKSPKDQKKLAEFGKVEARSVKDLPLVKSRMCLLDPNAGGVLTPYDCKNQFEYLIFGGILGDDPPKGRTKKAFAGLDCNKRNLGNKQMSTDTAVYVAKKIAEGTQFADIEFVDELAIPVDKGEEIILPYRYVVENGKPVLADGYTEFVKENKWE
jgi:ribosome biogenesis SPOUT family RNA methylase Rps3